MRNSTLCLAFALVAVLALGGAAGADPPGKEGTARGDGSDKPQVGRGLQGLARAFGDRNGKVETGSFRDWYLSVVERAFANRNANRGGFPDGGLGRLGGLGGSRGVNTKDVVDRILSFDKNKDSKITKDELPERMQDQVARGDTNKDGALDKDEIRNLATMERSGQPSGQALVDPELEQLEQLRKRLQELRRERRP